MLTEVFGVFLSPLMSDGAVSKLCCEHLSEAIPLVALTMMVSSVTC